MRKTLVLALLFITQVVFAQIPKPQKDTYVNDFAHILTTDQIKELNRKIYEIENKSSVQIAVVLVNTIPPAYEIDDYALLIGKKWHVGKDKNGLVYVASIDQHKQRLQVASKLAVNLTNEKCTTILDEIKPYFQRSDYNGGLTTLISQVSSSLGVVIQAPAAPRTASGPVTSAVVSSNSDDNNKSSDDSGSNLDALVGLGFVVLVIVLIIYLVRRSRRNNMAQMYNNIPNNGMYNQQYPGGMGGTGSGIGTFVAGAATGALVGYAAEKLMDNGNSNNTVVNNAPSNNNANVPYNTELAENNPENYGNWGGGSATEDNSSISEDNGFSDDDDNGATNSW